jgi:hypothetical protein
VIFTSEKQKYFCQRGWTTDFDNRQVICPSGQFVAAGETHPPLRAIGWRAPDRWLCGGVNTSMADVRFGAHNGLTSHIVPCPKSAMKRRTAGKKKLPEGGFLFQTR